ncbi:MAG: family 78 glycoside hydrolase catalytic domain [Clostridia bacterium]|nr:family 78 glycoside hydrolase catalytic domain [Clostridia bacterium]
MTNENWIARRDMPRLPFGENGEGWGEIVEESLQKIDTESSSVTFRKEYVIEKSPQKAIIKICGLGFYHLYIDGKKVGNYSLSPLETAYRKLALYDEFDVTSLLSAGTHTVAVELGNARFSTPKKYWGWRAAYYGDPCLAFEMSIKFADGTSAEYACDSSWKCSHGATTHNCYYDGERFDARLEQSGWKCNGFDDSAWQNALCIESPSRRLEKNEYFHITKRAELDPISVKKRVNGKTIHVFGENISGWVRIKVRGERGEKVRIRYAESMRDGYLDPVSNADAENVDEYILSGEGIEVYEPSFSFCGFSVVEVMIEDCMAELLEVKAFHVYADIENDGHFECDNGDINRLHDIILRTQKSALQSFPMDSPQRSERLGWMGDAHITDLVCLYNFDMRAYYRKFLEDIALCAHSETGGMPHIAPWHDQFHSIDWSSGFSIILWDHYLFYRDKSVLERYAPALMRYIEFLKTQGPILPKTRYGDWMSRDEGWTRGDPESCSTLYYLYNLIIAKNVLEALDRDSTEIAKLIENQKKIILDTFYDAENIVFDGNSQFSLSFALKLGVIPENDIPTAVDKLVANVEAHGYHLTTGILGTKYIMEALRDGGRYDIAMKLLLQDTYPSWLDMTRGKTTLPEQWDGGKSQNHCMFGSVDGILYSMLAGIKIDKEIEIAPYFAEKVNHVCANTALAGGKISVEWTRENKKITLRINIEGEVEVKYNNTVLRAGEHIFKNL